MVRRKRKNVEDFTEEVSALGERAGSMEWNTWFHRTLGVVGPLISSIFGIVVLGFLVWLVDFVGIKTSIPLFTSLQSFISGNMGLFFLIFLLFSYTSYFSKVYRKNYAPFSPVVTAAGMVVGLWLVATVFRIVGIQPMSDFAAGINGNLQWLFVIFIVVGYAVFAARKTAYVEVPRRVIVSKASKKKEVYYANRLYRSGKDRMLGGVCGGIAEYVGVDPTIIRLLWILGTFAFGFGILLYIIAWIIIPRNPRHRWN